MPSASDERNKGVKLSCENHQGVNKNKKVENLCVNRYVKYLVKNIVCFLSFLSTWQDKTFCNLLYTNLFSCTFQQHLLVMKRL